MRYAWRISVACGVTALLASGLRAQTPTERMHATLAHLLERQGPPDAFPRRGGGGTDGTLWALTRRFYAQRGGRPVWCGAAGPEGALWWLLHGLQRAEVDGLTADDYPVSSIRALSADPSPDSLALLDALATASFLRYAADVAFGRVVPAAVDTMWTSTPLQLDLVAWLTGALDSNRVGPALEVLAPPQPGAVRLRGALARYRAIALGGGWPALPPGPPLALGLDGPRVGQLRRRLEASGDLAPGGGGDSARFDAALEAAVRRAQARLGLEADGIVGRATVAALNVPVTDRIQQLKLNLERWRWLARELGDRYIAVNSAAFTLEVIDSGCRILVAPVIAGRGDWPTPIVSGALTDVAFNPRWNIPRSIAVGEILPAIRRDASYLAREGIHVMSDATEQAVELDPAAIPWDRVADSTFSYRLWQEPGPQNPLGRIRFDVSSRFGVALHDTPNHQPFHLRSRMLSHGCIRVAGARDLAAYVLRGLPGWAGQAEDSVRAALALPVERYVAVPERIPVHLTYWTAWVDEDGTVEFRPDVYGWDAELAAALRGSARGRERSAAVTTGR